MGVRRRTRRHIWGYSVCLCPIKGTPGLNELISVGDIVKLKLYVRKRDYNLCENKVADQLCSNCTADLRLCFRYFDSTMSHLLKSIISNFLAATVTVQSGLGQTWTETLKTVFLASRVMCNSF